MTGTGLLLFLGLGGCVTDIGVTETAKCDGQKQAAEATVDDAFDADGDGFFDGANSGCQAAYAAEHLDCNDGNPDVNPGAVESPCDGLDNDCDDTTPDATDADGDGSTSCDDCDDDDDTARPGLQEACGDEVDNDCDGEVDEDCDRSGTWYAASRVTYSCAWGNVNIDFDRFLVEENAPGIAFTPLGGGTQPGTMSGSVAADSFNVRNYLPGSCNEDYRLVGDFTSGSTFTAELTAQFSGSTCLDCSYQSWIVTATR